jgi:hypothetical protein
LELFSKQGYEKIGCTSIWEVVGARLANHRIQHIAEPKMLAELLQHDQIMHTLKTEIKMGSD